ncbi:hypothetical protein WG66_017063 [Moniliophthora roreri]|nr:hypothetical protein WG66_017063 [Moniliophthora roreri]
MEGITGLFCLVRFVFRLRSHRWLVPENYRYRLSLLLHQINSCRLPKLTPDL